MSWWLLLLVPWAFFWAGCACCGGGAECNLCSGATPAAYQVVLSLTANGPGSCATCSDFNGTYVVTQTANPCVYELVTSVSCGALTVRVELGYFYSTGCECGIGVSFLTSSGDRIVNESGHFGGGVEPCGPGVCVFTNNSITGCGNGGSPHGCVWSSSSSAIRLTSL